MEHLQSEEPFSSDPYFSKIFFSHIKCEGFFFQKIENAYQNNASKEEIKELLGRGRAKKGMYSGDLKDGELEIGQVSGFLDEIMPAGEIVSQIIKEFQIAQGQLTDFKL